jgi:hypothetical protein
MKNSPMWYNRSFAEVKSWFTISNVERDLPSKGAYICFRGANFVAKQNMPLQKQEMCHASGGGGDPTKKKTTTEMWRCEAS